jgi:hypothetical protein
MLVGIDDLHLDIKREGIYTGILQPVKVFYMLVGIDDLHLDIKTTRGRVCIQGSFNQKCPPTCRRP